LEFVKEFDDWKFALVCQIILSTFRGKLNVLRASRTKTGFDFYDRLKAVFTPNAQMLARCSLNTAVTIPWAP
jgi:hypothetical protein